MADAKYTLWVAVVGIAATLIGTLTAPIVAERFRVKSAQQERLHLDRLALYVDLLALTQQVSQTAQLSAALPPQSDDARLDLEALRRIDARVRLLSEQHIAKCWDDWQGVADEYANALGDVVGRWTAAGASQPVQDWSALSASVHMSAIAERLFVGRKMIIKAARSELGK